MLKSVRLGRRLFGFQSTCSILHHLLARTEEGGEEAVSRLSL